MEGYGYRLDTKPYVGGALEAKVLLESLKISATDAQMLYMKGVPIGHTVHMLRALKE